MTKVFLAFALVAHATLLVATGWFADQVLPVPFWVAQAVIGCGLLLVGWHYSLLKTSSRNIAEPTKLVTSGGLYPVVRHPMYLGDFVVIVGLALLRPTWFSMAAILLGAVALYQLARYEDSLMQSRFGEEFGDYRARSRLILPGLI